MGFTLRLAKQWLLFLDTAQEIGKRPLDDADIGHFNDWARRYGAIVRDDRGANSVALAPLLAIGREIASWFDEQGWMADLRSDGPLALDIAVNDGRPDEARAKPWTIEARASRRTRQGGWRQNRVTKE